MNRKGFLALGILWIFVAIPQALTFSTAIDDTNEGWITIKTDATEDLKDIYMINESAGFCVEDNGLIWKTTDAGLSWTSRNISAENFNCIDFTANGTGWSLGGTFAKTDDWGENWQITADLVTPPPDYLELYNDTYGWAVGLNTLYRLTDGENWSRITINGLSIATDMDFVNDKIGYVSGINESGLGAIYRTADGGLTWTPLGFSAASIDSIEFVNESTGYMGVAYLNGTYAIMKTDDGGNTWCEILSSSFDSFDVIGFVDSLTGWVWSSSMGGFYYTQNAGHDWIKETLDESVEVTAIYPLSTTHAWASAEDGKVLYTTNGGIVHQEETTESNTSEENENSDSDNAEGGVIDAYSIPTTMFFLIIGIIYVFGRERRALMSRRG